MNNKLTLKEKVILYFRMNDIGFYHSECAVNIQKWIKDKFDTFHTTESINRIFRSLKAEAKIQAELIEERNNNYRIWKITTENLNQY